MLQDNTVSKSSRGVYFISNDAVYDYTVAFLNSLRTFNPTIPLCLIPFDADACRIMALADTYGFIVWDPRKRLATCDNIARGLHRHVLGHYRKLAIWEGPFSEFVYIDVDTIILSELTFVFDLLHQYDILTGFSNSIESIKYVWKEQPTSYLSPQEIAYSANTGFIASRRGVMTVRRAVNIGEDNAALMKYVELNCMEQGFMNVVILKSGGRYSSLRQIRNVSGITNNLPIEVWGGDIDAADEVRTIEARLGIKPLMIHWAGLQRQRTHLQSVLWQHYRWARKRSSMSATL